MRRAVLLLPFVLLASCDDPEAPRCDTSATRGTAAATFTVHPGVEQATVFDAAPGAPMTLYDAAGTRLVTVLADEYGHAHFSYVPTEHMVLANGQGTRFPVTDGRTLKPGDCYVIRDDSQQPPPAAAFSVLGVLDAPDPSSYEGQSLRGIIAGILTVVEGQTNDQGFNYITVRDGVQLSAMVRFPDPALYGDGPYPTVIEYCGYSPSNPDSPEPGTRIGNLLGFATVAVNMRGTGCSGGVFDVFNPAQHADGYDIVEVVARQPWVLNGRVGMVGLSYSGIAQLFVGRTNPPHLAAITPLSVIADPWVQQWPGGVYNDGFTKSWIARRDEESASGGTSWVDLRIAQGDTVCAEHQLLRNQNIDFESFLHALEFYPPDAEERSLPLLVREIGMPVYLTGAFQDEQTGTQFADMLDQFVTAPATKFILYNGRHVDGYSPLVLTRWFEFLEFYVAGRVPRLHPIVRSVGGDAFSDEYGVEGLGFEPDRFAAFTDDQYLEALAAYEAEPRVRVLFENGGHPEYQPGAPVARFEATYDTFPPREAVGRSFYLDRGGLLADAPPVTLGVDEYTHDPAAGPVTFFGPRGYELMPPLWDIDWTYFAEGKLLTYLTPAFTEEVVVVGPSFAELWMTSEVDDFHVQVTLSEVRPDGVELLLQSGWLRAGHRKLAATQDLGLFRVVRTFKREEFEPVTPGEWVSLKIPLPAIGHALRAGSRLLLTVATPGRNQGTWTFESPDYGGATPAHRLAHGPEMPSRLFLPTVSGIGVPEGLPACPSLRGQPCRSYVPTTNRVVQ